MREKIKKLINNYQIRCRQIEEEWCTIDESGEPQFNYDCDYDDQLMTAEIESEYCTFLAVIADLEEALNE